MLLEPISTELEQFIPEIWRSLVVIQDSILWCPYMKEHKQQVTILFKQMCLGNWSVCSLTELYIETSQAN